MQTKLKELRKQKRLSQQALADFLDCDQSLYSKIERGERPLSWKLLNRLAEFYDVSADYMMGRTDNPKVNR